VVLSMRLAVVESFIRRTGSGGGRAAAASFVEVVARAAVVQTVWLMTAYLAARLRRQTGTAKAAAKGKRGLRATDHRLRRAGHAIRHGETRPRGHAQQIADGIPSDQGCFLSCPVAAIHPMFGVWWRSIESPQSRLTVSGSSGCDLPVSACCLHRHLAHPPRCANDQRSIRRTHLGLLPTSILAIFILWMLDVYVYHYCECSLFAETSSPPLEFCSIKCRVRLTFPASSPSNHMWHELINRWREATASYRCQ
jgi:hypothetical protein